MKTIGKLDTISVEQEVKWVIPNFFSLSKKDDEYYDSQIFTFNGELWYLNINPNCIKNGNPIEQVDFYLVRKYSGPAINLNFTFSIINSDGEEDINGELTHVFKDEGDGLGGSLISRSDLFKRKSELVPGDVLTVVFSLDYTKSNGNESDTSAAECHYCKENFSTENISWHEKKCMNKPIKCPHCFNVVLLQDWLYDHECPVEKVEAFEKLFDDLNDMMMSEDHSDITIKVKDEEFQLHKIILGSRSPYFNAMFNSNMKEGVVSIDDCEPEIFSSFIYFLYNGEVDEISTENVCDLYEISDKYQEKQLKEQCLRCMMNWISVDCFFDFVSVALKYQEKELLKIATELFTNETKEIIQSSKWLTFLKEYPEYANELYIKGPDKQQSLS